MQIIIIGGSKVGIALAEALLSRGESVVLIEQNESLVRIARNMDNCVVLKGVPIDQGVLRKAGIETADVVCAVTINDNLNIMATQIAKQVFNVPQVITRLYDPRKKEIFQEFGLDTFCSTDYTVAAILRELDDATSVSNHKLFGRTLSYEILPAPEDVWGEHLVDLLPVENKRIIGYLHGDSFALCNDEVVLQKGDKVVLCTLD